jgi:hypothetical protein
VIVREKRGRDLKRETRGRISHEIHIVKNNSTDKPETRRQKLEREKEIKEKSPHATPAYGAPADTFPGHLWKGLGGVVVEFFFVGAGQATAEEAFVAVLAAIGASE